MATNKQELDPKYDQYDFPTVAPTPQKGHPGHTTPQEDAQVFQLRMMLEQEGYTERLDTLTLLRYLRARKFDVNASKKMFVDTENWRKEFGGGVDDLTRTFEYKEKKDIFNFYPQYYHKTDKDGRPVYIEHLGKINLVEMQKITTDDRMLQNLVVEYEKLADPRLPACSRKSGYLLETCCSVFDAKGVSLTSAPSVYGYLQMATGISQNYYPERLGKLYIINAPWGFSTVFAVVKRFLDPVTVAKIHILGTGYQKELLGQIPAENLPKSLGGTCDCPGGCMFSDLGPWKDPQWVKPAKWETPKKTTEETVQATTTSSGVPGETGAATEGAPAATPADPTKEKATAPAPA